MRISTVASVLVAGVVLLAPTGSANEQHGPYHENPRWGYKVRAPKNWPRRAIRLDELWIADKFFPAYELAARNEQNEVVMHKPDLWVIGFPREREGERVRKEKIGENSWFISIRNPYKDYKDFVKRESWASTGRGGWYFSREERIEHQGYPVDVYEIKVEKLVRAPLRVVTWVYHCEGVSFAVQARILEAEYEKNKGVIDGCMKSFREIPRTEPFPQEEESARPRVPTEEDAKELTLEEINEQRRGRVEQRIERELENLPKGWRSQTSKHFVALTQIDKRYTGYVLNFAEEIRDYLDEHFGHIGPAKVPRGLVRVFSSSEEEHAYQQGTRGWWTDEVGEITMTIGRDAGILSEFSWLAGRLTDQYFQIKNENLKWGMPGWIRHGIWGHIQWARPSKRKKMILAPMPHAVREIALLLAKNEQLPLRELMQTATSDYESYGQLAQASSVVFWLLTRGNRGKTKGAIAKYLESLESIVEEEDEKFEQAEQARMRAEAGQRAKAAAEDPRKTEEELEREEDEAYRKRRQNRNAFVDTMKEKYAAIRARAFEAAFGHLSEKDWESLDKKWKKFAGG